MLSGSQSPKQLMTITEAAKQMPYSATFLRQLARQGKLNATKIGRDRLLTRAELAEFIHSQATRHEQALLELRSAIGEGRP